MDGAMSVFLVAAAGLVLAALVLGIALALMKLDTDDGRLTDEQLRRVDPEGEDMRARFRIVK